MTKFSTVRFNAGNDSCGNPRRVFVVFCKGEIIASYNEEYRGEKAIYNRYHRAAYCGVTIMVTPKEYKDLVSGRYWCKYLLKEGI